MEINRRPLEPIHGILARHAAQRNEHPRRVIQRLLPETGAVSFSVVLPTHLELLAATLREHAPGGALTAPALAAQHTFFPAISTFLEEDERADLLRRMLAGDRVAPYPICHVARAGGEAQTMRWCPECARVDRASIIPDASWRMPHQIFGVRACAEHGCRLIQAPCGFGDPPPERALSPITVHFTTPDGQRVAAAKEEFLAARRANPTASRSDLRVFARNACILLVRADPEWLAENFPQRRKKAIGVSQDWTALDGELAAKVIARAAVLRLDNSRPDRITATVLRRGVDGMRWAAASWRIKLPRFHAALDAEADTDFAYGDRRARWYHGEMLAMRVPTTNGVDVFLKRAALAYLATKEPRIRDLVRHLVLG